ncbi:MAG TPA: substrate-binding domain-containing protein, partial [Micromonospora sp.]
LMLIDTAGDQRLEKPGVRALLQRNVEAMIFAVEFHRDVDLPPVPDTVPTVVLNGRPADDDSTIDWVVPDEVGGAYAATRLLIGAGHRRIAFCNIADATFVARSLRQAGYERALAAAGIPADPSLVVEAAGPDTSSGREAAARLLRRPDRPTAVFCFSDQIAFGFYQVALGLGLAIPRDLSIVGFDNQQFVADSLLPGLTTVQLPHREMGTWAAKQALARVRGTTHEAPAHRLMPCPVITRASVAGPADTRP